MCGLTGIIGPGINNTDTSALETLAYVSGLRGLDSAGIIQGCVDYHGKLNYFVEKGTHDIIQFMDYHRYNKAGNRNVMNDLSDNFMLLHNRKATMGAITPDNAHPFEFETIVGMHNGTLKDKKYEDKDKTDSEMMFADMNERGILEVIQNMDFFSAYALVMLDLKDQRIKIVKNKDRSLFYMVHNQRHVMYYASEARFLEFARMSHHLDCGAVQKFEDDVLYSFSPRAVKAKVVEWDKERVFPWGEPLLPERPATRHTPRLPSPAAAKKAGKRGKESKTNTVSPVKGPAEVGHNSNVIDLNKASQLVEEAKLLRAQREANPSTFDPPWHNDLGICLWPRMIPDTKCIYCKKSMTLYEQYKGVVIDKGLHSCEECEAEQAKLFEDKSVRMN